MTPAKKPKELNIITNKSKCLVARESFNIKAITSGLQHVSYSSLLNQFAKSLNLLFFFLVFYTLCYPTANLQKTWNMIFIAYKKIYTVFILAVHVSPIFVMGWLFVVISIFVLFLDVLLDQLKPHWKRFQLFRSPWNCSVATNLSVLYGLVDKSISNQHNRRS